MPSFIHKDVKVVKLMKKMLSWTPFDDGDGGGVQGIPADRYYIQGNHMFFIFRNGTHNNNNLHAMRAWKSYYASSIENKCW